MSLCGQIRIALWCLLRFFDEAMQRDQLALVQAENDTGDAIVGQGTANLPKPFSEITAQRHANRPAPLHAHHILAHYVAVGFGQLS